MNNIYKTIEVNLDSKPHRTRNAKAVYCITTGKVYASGRDAALDIGCHPSEICRACYGHNTHTRGNRFCFVSEINSHILEVSAAMANAYKNANEANKNAKQADNRRIELITQLSGILNSSEQAG